MDDTRDAALYDALAERLRANGLARVVDALLRLARPAIHLDLIRADDEANIPSGASKVGGAPDLPASAQWPTTASGQPLPFIAQIRLADTAPYDPEGDLPHAGLLSFFYALNEASGELRVEDDPSAWRVIWTDDDRAPLARHLPPAALTANDARDSHFPACSVSFARRLTLPGPEAQAVEWIGFTNDKRLGYINVTVGDDVGFEQEMDLRLLGYPYELEPFTFTSAYRNAHGIERPPGAMTQERQDEMRQALDHLQEVAKGWRPPADSYTSADDALRAISELSDRIDMADALRTIEILTPRPFSADVARRVEEINRLASDEWRLLLQVYSNEPAAMDWAGGGVIHFGVKRDALAARDFSRVWVSLQFL